MTKNELIQRFQKDLPGAIAHDQFAPYRKRFEDQAENIRKKAAVAIHLYLSEGHWCFILIERSSYEGNHSAQMAFPGGKPEPTDLHLEHTARRESEEELGIPSNEGEKLAELSMVWIPVSSFEVTPYVFLHEKRPSIEMNLREVAQVFDVRIVDLLNETSVSTTTIQVNDQVSLKNIPCFLLNNKIVWGATALILAELKILLQTH